MRKAENGPAPIDPLDKQLVEQLMEDGRRSYVQLASAVGLSEAAVRQRVQRLLESGVMQVVAITDPMTLGFRRMALIGIKTQGDLMAVAEAASAIPEVDYVVLASGRFDLLIEVVCEDDAHLLSILNDRIRSLPGVRETESFIYLRLHKQTYNWGTR